MTRYIPWFTIIAAAIMADSHAAVVINEINYRPETGYPENTGLEYIELHNTDVSAVDISAWQLTSGVSFTFPATSIIPAGGFVVVASNPLAVQAKYGATGVFGPWAAGAALSDNDENVRISKPDTVPGKMVMVDELHYAAEGDWATRIRETTYNGWDWSTPANGGGKSIELRNPALSNDNGQNWAPSAAASGGTPGAPNSVLTNNVPPIIHDVSHNPAVPKSSEPVTIRCSVNDELSAANRNATLHWREASAQSPGPFQTIAMTGDGSGKFAATLDPKPNQRIVEFYISSTDGVATRTWPAATSEGQNANCQYQVNDEVLNGTDSYYFLVLTAAENQAFNNVSQNSDRQFNQTFIAVRGTETTIRYSSSMRIRGNSSRSYQFKPLRISLPGDDPWDGVTDFNLNPKASFLQVIGMRTLQLGGVRCSDAVAVRLRRNGVNSTTNQGSTPDYGFWARLEETNRGLVSNHWPEASTGNLYKKIDNGGGANYYWRSTGTAPGNPNSSLDGYSKQNNSGANDWTDLTNFFQVWQTAAAPHFPGAPAGDVAESDGSRLTQIGKWDGTAFTAAEIESIETVSDLDQWARFLAVMTIMQDLETKLSNGVDDDYELYFEPGPGGQRRMQLLAHDMDTVFNLGDTQPGATDRGLYDATADGHVFRTLLPLLGNNTTAGDPTFRQKYHDEIRKLYGGAFNASTAGNPNPPFYAFLDSHLAGWVPASTLNSMKSFATTRQGHLLGLIGQGPIVPPAPTSTATLSGPHGSIYISEVLARNVAAHQVAGTFPDYIEIRNAGDVPVDLGGIALTDDPLVPTKFTFPANTIVTDGGYLIVYADSNSAAPGLHTGFALDQDGDQVRLYASEAAGGALLDSITFGPQAADQSISRTGAAFDEWNLTTPTPGVTNSAPVSTGSVAGIRINEIYTNPNYLFDHDFVELLNTSAQPVAIGGVRLTDDAINYPTRNVFPPLSFIGAGDFLVLRPLGNNASPGNPTDLAFKFSALSTIATLSGANGTVIDQFDVQSLPSGVSRGRSPDGALTLAYFGLPLTIPTPGGPNVAPPASILALLNQLRVTELLYKPNNLEFLELQNIGATALDISGVRFTEGVNYTFPPGMTLAPGAYIVVCKDRSAFTAQFPSVPLAPGQFTGVLDNSGETITLQPPAPYDVNILSFRYESTWYPETNNDRSLVVIDPAGTPPRRWDEKETWMPSLQSLGSPGIGLPPIISGPFAASGIIGDVFNYQINASQFPASYSATGLPSGLTINTSTGAISGTPTVAGVSNITIGATNPLGSDSKTLVITISEYGPLANFAWDNIGNQIGGQPFVATLRARDAGGRTVKDYAGAADTSAVQAVPIAKIAFTEVGTSTPTPDYFELQNLDTTAADTTGWIVFTNRSSGVNQVNSITWPLPTSVAPGQIIGACDNTATPAPTETIYAGDIDWPGNSPNGWVMLVDNNGGVRDFVAWGYSAAEIASINFTVSGTNYTVGTQWSGNGAPLIPGSQSLFRKGTSDSNIASDWVLGPTPNPRGTQNTGLTLPFESDFAFANMPGTGLGAVNLTNGVWTGQITVQSYTPIAELHAAITGQPLIRSNQFAVTSTGTNTPPSFTKGSDITVNEDSGARSFVGWATDISPGLPSESLQTVSFLTSNDNNTLFSVQPAVTNAGTLTFTTAQNANGSATVSVRARDNGGTANGGADTSAPQTFAITVQPVNDPPIVFGGTNLGVGQTAGPQSLAWATFLPGPTNEASQTIVSITVENDNHSLFTVQPSLAGNGTLSFTPSTGGSGVANVTVTLTDNGGTSNGGNDTTVRNFTITVTGINDSPFFTAGPDVVAPINVAYSKAWATGIAPGPPDESAQNVAFYVLTNNNPSLFTVQPRIKPDGTLEFTPGKSTGTATLTVQLRDSGGTENGGSDASTIASFSIRLASVAAAAGKFRGLIAPAGAPTKEQSGLGEFTLSAKGSFSGKLKIGGKTFGVAGLFDGGGNATFGRNGSALTLKRTNLAPLALSMQLNLAGATPTITGQILDGAAPYASFTAERDAYKTKTAPVPVSLLDSLVNKGNYTAAFLAQAAPNNGLDAAQYPQGDGWVVVKLTTGGTVTMRGQFADGSKFAYASGLNSANSFPLYVPLYKLGGAVAGTIAFADPGLSSAGLTWFRPAILFPKPAPQYSQGWPLGIALGFEGSTRNVVTEPNVLPVGNATLTLTGGNPDVGAAPLPFTIGIKNKVTAPLLNGKKVAIVIKPTGQWSGSFTHPITFKKTLQQGVILRHLGSGTGFFLGGSESGRATITTGP